MSALCKELSVQGAAPRRKDAIRSILNRQSALVGTAAALVMVAMTPSNALAACASSLDPIVCSADANKHAGGISYSQTDDLSVIIEDGVEVEPTSGTDAVYLESYFGDVSLSSGATIVVDNGHAIDVYAYGNAVITQTGAIVSTGQSDEFGAAVRVYAYDGYADVSVADITTSGYEEDALQVESQWGSASVTVDGSLSTSGNNAWGVSVLADDSADLTVTGDVSTLGNASTAIRVSAGGPATVTVGGTVSTAGSDSDGVEVYAVGDATVSLTDVSTQGYASAAINIGTYATWDQYVGGNVTLTAGAVSTAGNSSTAVYIDAQGTVTATLGNVSTLGRSSDAIVIDSDGYFSGEGDPYSVAAGISLTAGAISTQGYDADGVDLYAQGGAVVVTLDSVSTQDDDSDAIYIETASTLTDVNGDYVVAAGDVTLTVAGDITTLGDDADAVDIHADGTVNATLGNVSTQGWDSGAIHIATYSNYGEAVDVTLTVGDVSTQGGESDAINLEADAVSGQTANIVLTAGNVSTAYLDSDAVTIEADGSVTATLGKVSTLGRSSDAIEIDAYAQ